MRSKFAFAAALLLPSLASAQAPFSQPSAASLPGASIRLYGNRTIPAGNTVVNTTAETAFASRYPMPANYMQVGDIYDLEGWGIYKVPVGNMASTDARIRLIGGGGGNYLLADTGALTNPAGSLAGTAYGYHFKLKIMVTAIGTSGSLMAPGTITFSAGATSLDAELPGAAIAVDTTQTLSWQASAQFSAATATVSNTLLILTLDKSQPATSN